MRPEYILPTNFNHIFAMVAHVALHYFFQQFNLIINILLFLLFFKVLLFKYFIIWGEWKINPIFLLASIISENNKSLEEESKILIRAEVNLIVFSVSKSFFRERQAYHSEVVKKWNSTFARVTTSITYLTCIRVSKASAFYQ